jgi:hypothetical protein
VAEEDRMALFPPVHDGVPSEPGDVWQDRGRVTAPPDPQRRRNMTIALTVLGAAVLVVLGYLGAQLGTLFTDGGNGPAIVVDDNTPAQSGPPPAGQGGPNLGVAVAGVEVYDEVGDRDNSERVARVIDNDPETAWNTSAYRQQFPAFKPGVGIMVSFASAVQLSELTIESPSRGTVVEVRSAPTADAPLDETTPITEATLRESSTTVSMAESQPVTHVLLWITSLSGGEGDYSSVIQEIGFERAGE